MAALIATAGRRIIDRCDDEENKHADCRRNACPEAMKDYLPDWAHPWVDLINLGLQIALIIVGALLLRAFIVRLIGRIVRSHNLPLELIVGGRRFASILIFIGVVLLVLDRFNVSGAVLWTAVTGFATVAAVAFFAAWSVLSNIFCAVLIYTTRPFRLHDHIEILENGDKPGLGGEVLDIRLIYTTIRETLPDREPTLLQVPNSLFFQRLLRVRIVDAEMLPAVHS
ncbi:mechanosensitive ion channel domain-containing protein [Azonexus sp.]|uniref:mechanosensitive ion channel domain-containing protein n=1 Tax=Azonexus sp. TaxID=1872668 RepID=UPI0035B241C4